MAPAYWVAVLALTGPPIAPHRGPAPVELRAREEAPAGEVAAVGAGGVFVKPSDGGPNIVITWDRVKSVRGAKEADAAPFLALADKAWRARTRLERGDAIGAEALFEEVFRGNQAKGPTGAVIAEGLLRCRLRSGAHVLAAEAWLALLESTGGEPGLLHARWAEEAGLSPVLDPATRLIPAIPPIWCGPGAGRIMAGLPVFTSVEPAPTGTDAGAALGALYHQAARFEAGEEAFVPEIESGDAGVALVRQIVLSRIGDGAQRQAARGALESRVPPAGGGASVAPWIEAWCRVAIGRSLLREEGRDQKQLGVIELLSVPARLADAHPYLTGVALAEASLALADLGDPAGASVLLDELRDRYPEHPVLEWNPIRLQPARPVASRAGASAEAPPAK